MMSEFCFIAAHEADTRRLGAALAALVPDGTVVSLSGTLGAGKTRLVQAVAEACGIDRQQVTSPTFVLCQSYRGDRTIHHFDVYRLQDAQEFLDLGPDELFESAALSLVEWGEKVDKLLPADRLDVEIAVTGPEQRQFRIAGEGRLGGVVDRLERQLSSAG